MGIRIARWLGWALLFVGCAVRAEDTASAAEPTKGWVIFSMTATGLAKLLMVPTLYYKGVDNAVTGNIKGGEHKLRKDTGKLPMFIGLSNLVLDRNDPLGSIKIMELPAGEYVFDRFFAVGSQSTVYSQPNFRIPFTVKAGEISYLGNVNFDYVNLPAIDVQVYGDMAERDIKLFRERHANLAEVPLTSASQAPAAEAAATN